MTVSIMSNGEIRSAIGEITGAAGALQAKVHTVAVSCLAHIRDHGDTTLATGLLSALPNGQRVKALGAWFRHFSNGKAVFAFDKASAAWKCSLNKDRVVSDFDIEGANEITYGDLTTEKDPETMTPDKLVKYLTRVANDSECFKGTTKRRVTDETQAMAAKALRGLAA